MTTNNQNTKGNPKPDYIAKTREGIGKNASFNWVGAAWNRESGSIYFKPYGKQIIDSPVYLFINKEQEPFPGPTES